MTIWLLDLRWVWPWLFAAAPLPLIILWLRPPRTTAESERLRLPDPGRYALSDADGTAGRERWGLWALLFLAWLLLLAASARPQHLGPIIGVPQSGRDLLLAIDVSNSMRQNDFPVGGRMVSRMAAVRRVASDFVARRTGDRVGLVLFGTQAFVQTPLTRDHLSVQHFLEEAETGLAGQATAIGDAIGLAVKRLRERPDEARVIVLLTDGTNTAGALDPLRAARIAADEDVRIYTIGIGGAGRGGFFGGFSRGNDVDQALLDEIAALTDGRSFRASNREELEAIYATIDDIEPVEFDEERLRPVRELYHWPLAAALVLSCLWAWLRLDVPSAARRGESGQ